MEDLIGPNSRQYQIAYYKKFRPQGRALKLKNQKTQRSTNMVCQIFRQYQIAYYKKFRPQSGTKKAAR